MPDEPTGWPYVTASCVKGEVVVVIPYLGSAATLFPPPYDYVLMASILILIFLIQLLGGRKPQGERGATNGTPSPARFVPNSVRQIAPIP
jgi:hypothetical protein